MIRVVDTSLQFGLSFVGYSKKGLIPIISTKLPFVQEHSTIDTFLYRFSTPIGMLLGQGDSYHTGLFGPYPVPSSNSYNAFSYSFFLPDTILGTPRNDPNAYVIALLFIPKNVTVHRSIIEDVFNTFSSSLNNLNDLLSKKNFELFVKSCNEKLFSGSDKLAPKEEEVVIPRTQIVDNSFFKNNNDKNHVFIDLETKNEDIVAIPWILHAVYHGLEHAVLDVLGDSNSLIEMLMEQYTAEILDRYHLFDSIFAKEKPDVKDALELGVQHLAKVGEIVTIKALDSNKFECSINCSFASAVHPYLPINKCLWIRYLSAMVRRTLPSDKEMIIHNSDFDPAFGSTTIIEIIPKVFKTL